MNFNLKQFRNILVTASMVVFVAACSTTLEEDLGTSADSIAKAGVTSVIREPVLAPEGQKIVGERTHIVLGKEYGSFRTNVDLSCEDGQPIRVNVMASEVAAFQGQAIAAQAIVPIRAYLTEQNIRINEQQVSALSNILADVLKSALPAPTWIVDNK